MDQGICLQGAVPVRATPLHRTEMVSQLLFGELFQILEADGEWIRIRMEWDGYEGWILAVQAHSLDQDTYLKLVNDDTPVVSEPVQFLKNETSGWRIPLVAGSSLPGMTGNHMNIGNEVFSLEGVEPKRAPVFSGTAASREEIQKSLVTTALSFEQAPYCWGGRSILGIDCSGLTQITFKMNGIRIKRDASQQAFEGTIVPLISEAEPADLLFFDNDEGKITHVGMLLDPARIIHSSGRVRIDPVDHYGIFNRETSRYSYKLRMIRRMF
ncbi:MAG: hydrolase Nlp/P60 [Alphaproteobacteria bacterium]|nr:hydrolase Nlp/P60 [Alphaproteobacteria bacterium]